MMHADRGILRDRMAFAMVKGMRRVNADSMLGLIGSETLFFEVPERELAARVGRMLPVFSDSYRSQLRMKAARELDFVEDNNIRCLYFKDDGYPARLRECDDVPLMVYTVGDCEVNDTHVVSVVGTRHATPYGVDFVNRLVEDLAQRIGDVLIVSGLAYGIDVAAHRAALKYGLPTAAVLAHGLNTIYPAAHRQVAAEMARNGGMLLTDYTSADVVHRGNFLARNRIVAGMSDCTVVVESARKGGAMVTASIAGGYSREVMAVPGRTSDPYSEGCNHLIATNQATMIRDASDLIAACRWVEREQEAVQGQLFYQPTEKEQAVLDYIVSNPESTVNGMSVGLGMPSGSLMSLLIDMEFKDLIIAVPGGRYALSNK